ncbi:DUF3047 domain-containing protein [Oligoflexaceae bacterium]|nr:DUF3047 domain-containing protein [Oligoflexaceae bacterium]
MGSYLNKKSSIFLVCFILNGCTTFGPRENLVRASKSQDKVKIFQESEYKNIDHLPRGWHHYKFRFTDPSAYEQKKMTDKAFGIECKSDDSASMLLRQTDLSLRQFPYISWTWRVDKNVNISSSEKTKEGDDSAARLFIVVSDANKKEYMFELYWAPELISGKSKTIDGFYHYAVRGSGDRIREWTDESINLSEIVAKRFGKLKSPTVTVIGMFCDSDGSGGESSAVFRDVFLRKAG